MRRSEKFLGMLLLTLMTVSCAMQQGKLAWRVKDMALEKRPVVELLGLNEEVLLTIPTRTIQEMTLAHFRISRAAKIQSELFIIDGDEPNAFAARDTRGQRMIAINLGMVKLIGNNAAEYAALIAHEAAHWAKGHVESGETRTSTLNAVGTLVGVGLSAAGIPAAGLITGPGVDLVDSSFNRDQEREADAMSIEYLLASGYDPWGAVALQEKFLTVDHGARLSFLSSHPSGAERIQNLKTIIEGKVSALKAASPN
jgi:predicted Zn-dependent protease